MASLSAIATALLAATLSSAVFAQELKPSDAPSAGGDIDKVGIAKKLANPIANMISVPCSINLAVALELIKVDLNKLCCFSQ
jgi:hypothetical protein